MNNVPHLIGLYALVMLAALSQFQTAAFGQTPEDRLQELGIALPEASQPVANYVKYVRTGNLVFLAGHGSCGEPTEVDRGKLGENLTTEQGYQAAQNVGVCILATLKDAIGDLDKVAQIVKVEGMVNATPDFTDHSNVINGFSDLMVAVFGDRGKHARQAVGMASLPSGLSVEVSMIVEVSE